jgi:hypothetical protein
MRRVATGKQNTISQVEFTDLVALTKRGAETGELFAYEPSTRQVEVYRGPRSTPVEVYTLTSRPPAFAGRFDESP